MAVYPHGDAGVVARLLGRAGGPTVVVTALAEAAPVVMLLNRYDPRDRLHRANLAWLRHRCGLDVLVGPAALAARMTTPNATASPTGSR